MVPKTIKSVIRIGRSKDFPNPATHAAGTIALYDTAFKSDLLLRIMIHEIAHEIYEQLPAPDIEDYKFATNWFSVKTKQGKNAEVRRSNGFVKEDGRFSPEEDFANNLEFYILDEPRLKSVTPQAHQWMKSRYGAKLKLRSACANL